MKAVFVSHGAPTVALANDDYTRALAAYGAASRPRAIVVVSAHWRTGGPHPVIGGAAQPEVIYDFGGFPAPLYELQYPAKGEPALAAQIAAALPGATVDETRGFDHGVWIPLRLMYPQADIPVVTISLPRRATHAGDLFEIGQKLAKFDVLLIGSGSMTHNLGELEFEDALAPVTGWAKGFDDWAAGRLAVRDDAALLDFLAQGPEARRNHPTWEHLAPLFVVLGATGAYASPTTVFEGFRHGSLSMRTVAFG